LFHVQNSRREEKERGGREVSKKKRKRGGEVHPRIFALFPLSDLRRDGGGKKGKKRRKGDLGEGKGNSSEKLAQMHN